MTRLKVIEKKQELLLAKIASSEETTVHFVNEAKFEAQQAVAMAENNNTQLRKIIPTVGSTEQLVIGQVTELHEQGKKLEAIKNFLTLKAVEVSPKPSAPPPAPSKSFNSGESSYEQRIREQRAADSVRALEGIRDELQQRRINELTK